MRKTIALAVAAVTLAGCGVLPGRQGGGGEERQPSQAVAETPTEKQPSTTPAQAQQSTSPQDTKVIASRETDVYAGGQHGKARADIIALKRQGRTLTLNWTVTSLDGKVGLHNGMGTAPLDFSVAGVSLIDPVNAKRYRVARNGTDENAKCVCSGTQGQWLEKGEASTLYAVFAAPPADVTKINIEMPMIGVLTDVPIS
ncbi:hypothetical protein [Nonomuraea sp. NPDC049695]|uniref:hypothetical protein n=1 Tax=Nonomuraea sp. NPDC049695 TaxID=3154734 RepID=UPI003442C053